MILELLRQHFLSVLQFRSLSRFLLGDLHELGCELSFILLQPLSKLLDLHISLGNVSLYLSQCLILLLQTILIHLVEVNIGHQCIALITHSVLLFVDLTEPAFWTG